MPHKMYSGMPFLTWEQTTATWGIWSMGQGKLKYQTHSYTHCSYLHCSNRIYSIQYREQFKFQYFCIQTTKLLHFQTEQQCWIFRGGLEQEVHTVWFKRLLSLLRCYTIFVHCCRIRKLYQVVSKVILCDRAKSPSHPQKKYSFVLRGSVTL